jgi:CubicO group peptidase (beta-lactamase class C family)
VSGSELDRQLETAVDRGAVPGVAAVVVGRDGVLYEGAAGVLRTGGGERVDGSTMFRYASMTKPITSVAALQLVESGRLALDQTVASVLPAFGDLEVLEGFDDDGRPRLRPPARQATVGQLLNHTAGQGYWFSHADLLRYHEATDTPNVMSGTLASLGTPLVADPGTRWEYGTNTDWLGRVVEEVAGEPLDAYFAEHILEPLGMADTTFAPDDERRARLMAVHHRTPDGGLVAGDLDLPADPEFLPGGHGAQGTARDYGRFMSALLAGGELDGAAILRPETVEMAFSDHLGGIALPELVRSADPDLSNDIVLPPFAQGWGLGFHLTLEDLPGMRRAGSGDWAGLFNSYFWIDRASGLAAAILTQVLPFFDAEIVEMTLGFEACVYSQIGARQPA